MYYKGKRRRNVVEFRVAERETEDRRLEAGERRREKGDWGTEMKRCRLNRFHLSL